MSYFASTLRDFSEKSAAEELATEVTNNDILRYGNSWRNDTEESKTKDNDELDTALMNVFKEQVKSWLELDVEIKRLGIAMKERKNKQAALTGSIIDFMNEYDIEDLSTRLGTLRCKKSIRKTPVGNKELRERLSNMFKNDPNVMDEIVKIFAERASKEVVSLKRLNM